MKSVFAGKTKEEYMPLLKKAQENDSRLANIILEHIKNEEKYMKKIKTKKLLVIAALLVFLIIMISLFRAHSVYFLLSMAFVYLNAVVCIMIYDENAEHIKEKRKKEKKYWKKLQIYKQSL